MQSASTVEEARGSGRRCWFTVGLLTRFADNGILFVQILAIGTGPHAARFCVAAAKKKARAKSENSNPSDRRNEKPQLGILFDPFRIRTKHHSNQSHEERSEKIANHGQSAPKPRFASSRARKTSDPGSSCNEKRDFKYCGLRNLDHHGFLVFAEEAAKGVGDFADGGVSFDGGEDGREKVFSGGGAALEFGERGLDAGRIAFGAQGV